MTCAGRRELLAVFGDPVSPELARTLDLGGYRWKAVASADDAAEHEPPGGWAGAIIDCGADPTGAWAFARTIRKREPGNAAGAGAGVGRPARRARAARRAVRRLLPGAVPPGRAGGPRCATCCGASAAAPGRT